MSKQGIAWLGATAGLLTALAALVSALNGSGRFGLFVRPPGPTVGSAAATTVAASGPPRLTVAARVPPGTSVAATVPPVATSACTSTGVVKLRCEVLTNLAAHQGAVWSLSFDRTGAELLSGAYQDPPTITWTMTADPRNAKQLGPGPAIAGSPPVLAVAWSPTSDPIVSSGAADGVVRIWDAVSGQETFALDKAHSDSIWSLAWDGRGVFLASGSSDGIRVWAPGVDDRHAPYASLPDVGARVFALAWIESNDSGGLLAGGLADGRIILWDAPTGTIDWVPADGTAIRGVAWSDPARALASGSEDGSVHVWYRDTGRNIRLPEQHREAVYSVAWSRDGGLLASGSNDGAVKLWRRTPEGMVLAGSLDDPRKQVFALAWGGNDLLAIGRQDHQIELVRVTY